MAKIGGRLNHNRENKPVILTARVTDAVAVEFSFMVKGKQIKSDFSWLQRSRLQIHKFFLQPSFAYCDHKDQTSKNHQSCLKALYEDLIKKRVEERQKV
jgi:hypothetical protein